MGAPQFEQPVTVRATAFQLALLLSLLDFECRCFGFGIVGFYYKVNRFLYYFEFKIRFPRDSPLAVSDYSEIPNSQSFNLD